MAATAWARALAASSRCWRRSGKDSVIVTALGLRPDKGRQLERASSDATHFFAGTCSKLGSLLHSHGSLILPRRLFGPQRPYPSTMIPSYRLSSATIPMRFQHYKANHLQSARPSHPHPPTMHPAASAYCRNKFRRTWGRPHTILSPPDRHLSVFHVHEAHGA